MYGTLKKYVSIRITLYCSVVNEMSGLPKRLSFGGTAGCVIWVIPERVPLAAAEQINASGCVPLFFSVLLRGTKAERVHSGEPCLYYCFPGYFEVWFPLGFFLSWLFDLFCIL